MVGVKWFEMVWNLMFADVCYVRPMYGYVLVVSGYFGHSVIVGNCPVIVCNGLKFAQFFLPWPKPRSYPCSANDGSSFFSTFSSCLLGFLMFCCWMGWIGVISSSSSPCNRPYPTLVCLFPFSMTVTTF